MNYDTHVYLRLCVIIFVSVIHRSQRKLTLRRMTGTLTGQECHHPKRRPVTDGYEPFKLDLLYNTAICTVNTMINAANTIDTVVTTTESNLLSSL